MEERRSRCENLNAKAVEQGLVAAPIMVSTDDDRIDEPEPELAPAFDMDEIGSGNVSENEIRLDESSTMEDVLDTASDVDEIVIDNPTSSVSGYFDHVEDAEKASEQPPEPEVAAEAEAEASPSYFGSLDEPVFEEPGPVLDEPEPIESIGSAEPAAEFESMPEIAEPQEIEPVAQEEATLEDVSSAAEPEAAEAATSPSYFGSLDEPVFEEPGPVLDEPETIESIESAEPAADFESMPEIAEPQEVETVEEEEATPAASVSELGSEIEEEPEAVEDLISQSDEWLAPEPELITDAEIRMAAEELVDRIGPVVDIQNLPKTQPSRVLSKTAKQVQEETPEAKLPTPRQESPQEPVVSKKEDDIVSKLVEDESGPKKKKKKKISLLDSYFKGL